MSLLPVSRALAVPNFRLFSMLRTFIKNHQHSSANEKVQNIVLYVSTHLGRFNNWPGLVTPSLAADTSPHKKQMCSNSQDKGNIFPRQATTSLFPAAPRSPASPCSFPNLFVSPLSAKPPASLLLSPPLLQVPGLLGAVWSYLGPATCKLLHMLPQDFPCQSTVRSVARGGGKNIAQL